MSILEAYRALISAGFSPKRTVEFHFYSAEVRTVSSPTEANLKIGFLFTRKEVYSVPKLSLGITNRKAQMF